MLTELDKLVLEEMESEDFRDVIDGNSLDAPLDSLMEENSHAEDIADMFGSGDPEEG